MGKGRERVRGRLGGGREINRECEREREGGREMWGRRVGGDEISETRYLVLYIV